ncbi:hypothetical protein ATK36_4859 [Amycolatopsis sulphurea]|uniref:Uncharacterized protein n=1 Tax=Amycolatopsis sulphurea TaxID=76022 RepID=A0A2A9FE09_9PSEU|nr:hypothetical protein [Amycolatopsis sulphurea]PFG49687.1 hypothetical protein ATK36_4859 [Amycolatopsis sulphurea]
MRKTIEVVDSFYRDPDAVRTVAASAAWSTGSRPGRTTAGYSTTEARDGIVAVLGWRPEHERPDFGYFALLSADSPRTEEIDGTAEWAAVVHLSPPSLCAGGTSFYRDQTLTEETLHIPVVFNRMVVFHASALSHRATLGFGSSPGNGRLTQVFLFEGAPA